MTCELEAVWRESMELDCLGRPTSAHEVTIGLMRQAMSSLLRSIDGRLRRQGITHAQRKELALLDAYSDTTPSDVAALLGTDTAAATRMLDRMENKGLCARQRATCDRRMVNLVITAAGRHALQRTEADYAAALARGFADVPPDQLALLRQVLERIGRASDTWSGGRRGA